MKLITVTWYKGDCGKSTTAIKESLRKHREAAGVSFAQAITEFVKAGDRAL